MIITKNSSECDSVCACGTRKRMVGVWQHKLSILQYLDQSHQLLFNQLTKNNKKKEGRGRGVCVMSCVWLELERRGVEWQWSGVLLTPSKVDFTSTGIKAAAASSRGPGPATGHREATQTHYLTLSPAGSQRSLEPTVLWGPGLTAPFKHPCRLTSNFAMYTHRESEWSVGVRMVRLRVLAI